MTAPAFREEMRKILVAILAIVCLVDAQFRCKNMNGKDVDWFVAIKLPANVDERKGRSFVYYDSSQSGWIPAIGATLKQLYTSNDKTTFKIAYNDDCPGKQVDSGRGHSKGVAVFTIDSGFWMVHSVPNFPPPEKYDYPETGFENTHSRLSVFRSMPIILKISARNLSDDQTHGSPLLTTLKLAVTRESRHLQSIRNSEKIYGTTSLLRTSEPLWQSRTWRNGAAKDVGTQCDDGENVYDVTSVKVLDKEYASSKDHSKWGVSMSESVPAVCIGDVNRQESQFKRGGGAVCIEDITLWRTFRGSVNSFLDCGVVHEKKSSKEANEERQEGSMTIVSIHT
ncbi:deoxyribonuclease II [Ostertagia ostertagi]